MAAPAASGMVAIIRQYFVAGWYPGNFPQSGESIAPTSMLIRGILCNSAVPVSTSLSTGYGLPCLAEALGFLHSGLRFADKQTIGRQETVKFTIRTESLATLSITLCYLDPPLSEESVNPLFADLDLVVVTPKNVRYMGNGLEDQFATTEKVVILNAEPGEYTAYVISSDFPDDIQIPFAIVANGGFTSSLPYLVREDVQGCPLGCGSGKCVGGLCDCGKDSTGRFCSEKVTKISRTSWQRAKVSFKEVLYYKFIMDADSFTLRIRGTSNKERATVCLLLGGRPTKIADSDSVCVKSVDGKQLVLNITEDDLDGLTKGSSVYLAVFGLTGSDMTVIFSIDGLELGKGILDWLWSLPLFWKIGILAVFSILLGCLIGVGLVVVCDKLRGGTEGFPEDPARNLENQIPSEELDEKVTVVADDEVVLA
jgi:hypothetical protein